MFLESKAKVEEVVLEEGDKDAGKLFEALMKTSTALTSAGIQHTSSASTAVYATLGTALGALQIAATLLSPRKNDVVTEQGLNNDTFAMATALLLVCTDCGTEGDGMTKVDYGSHKFGEAISMYKKITGKDVDQSKFNSAFLKAANDHSKNLN